MSEERAARRSQEAERLLHVSRRLDWRFLLPDCRLEDVGYAGDPRSALLTSLETFSRGVTILDDDMSSAEDARQFDVLVLRAPRRQTLRGARHLVRSGGCVYAEIYRLAGPWRRGTVLHPTSYAEAAKRGGFIDVELHWHWPDFENCTRLVPLHGGAAFGYLLSRGRTDAAARGKAAAGRMLLESGALGWGVRCFSVVARSP